MFFSSIFVSIVNFFLLLMSLSLSLRPSASHSLDWPVFLCPLLSAAPSLPPLAINPVECMSCIAKHGAQEL